MSSLKSVFLQSLTSLRSNLQALRKNHGSHHISHVKLSHILSGLHSVPILFHATSNLDPELGLSLRSIPIREVSNSLIKTEQNSVQPTIESIFWLLLTGQKPSKENIEDLKLELNERRGISEDLEHFLIQLPRDISPMAQYSMALLFLSKNSLFNKNVSNSPKDSVWELFLEDGLNLLAKSPLILHQIAKNGNLGLQYVKPMAKDWCGRLAQGLGLQGFESHDFMRLFALLHVDHEGGNVSTHTTMAAASAYADPFSAYSAGVNGLSGNLHGYANRDVMIFLMKLKEELGINPSKEDILAFVQKWRKHKGNVPGFGHAILRSKDLRFCLFEEWGLKYCGGSEILNLNQLCGEVISDMLTKQGKVKNPNPNVDFKSGSLLFHYGVKDIELYPVLFAVVRAFGCVANMVIERAVGLPIEYPLSMDLATIEKNLGVKHQ